MTARTTPYFVVPTAPATKAGVRALRHEFYRDLRAAGLATSGRHAEKSGPASRSSLAIWAAEREAEDLRRWVTRLARSLDALEPGNPLAKDALMRARSTPPRR